MNAVEPPFGNVLGDEEALSWLQNQPAGRLEVSVAELASLWGWGRTRVYRRLERWEQEGRIAKRGVPGGRWRGDRDIDDDVCVEIIGAIVNLMFQNETASWTTCGPSPTDGAARQAFLNCGQQGEPCVEPATHRYP